MIAKSTHAFAGGGMDANSAPEYIAPNDYLEAYNTRVEGTGQQEAGYVTNVESNALILSVLPAGINKAIGAEKFETVGRAYEFIFNSNNFHIIREYDSFLNKQTDLFTNLTDSAGVNVLKLSSNRRIKDIRLVDEKYLYFLDSLGQPCYINIEKLRTKGYGVLTADDFLLIKGQPIPLVAAIYSDDKTRSSNLMKGKLFQWRTQFEYLDFEQSFFSSISKRILPATEQTPSIATDVTKNNNQIVTVPVGTNRVKTVNVAMTYNELDWFSVKTVDRAYILTLPPVIDIVNNFYEAYDPVKNTYSFVFYNDGLYVPIPVLDTDEPFDSVPLSAEALENANGNVILLANIVEGYDTPVVKAEVGVLYIDKRSAVNIPTQLAPLKVNNVTVLRKIHKNNTGYYVINFSGIARVGDELIITTIDLDDGYKEVHSYTVEQSLDGNTPAVLNKLGSQYRLGHSVTQGVNGTYNLYFVSEANQDFLSIVINLANVGTGFSVSISSLKSNSSYQVGLVFYDSKGRYCPLYTDNSMIIKTQSTAVTNGAIPVITWTLSGTPPPWAVSYQWILTKNTTHATTLTVTAKLYKNDANYLQFYINSLRVFNKTNNSSVLNYQYSAGDRITFLYYEDGTTKNYFSNPAFDSEVVAFDPALETVKDDPATQYINEQKLDYILKVRKPSALDAALITGKNVVIEIYSPAKSLLATDQPFFEIGERFDIVNGEYSVKTGVISDGDVYYKSREIVSAVDEQSLQNVFVEDFNYSDFYKSNYTSYGRPHQYLKSAGQKRLPASIRFGQEYVKNSRVNLINRFYAANIYGESDGESTSNYGGIYRIEQFANILRVFQELNIGYIGIYTSIIEDQAEKQNVAISEKFLNKIQYSQVSQVGIGKTKGAYAENKKTNSSYFIDPNRLEPFRIGNNGLVSIAGKMSKYFRQNLKAAFLNGKEPEGYYDEFYDEYIIAFQTDDGKVVTINFDGLSWKTLEDYEVLPSGIAVIAPTDASLSYDSTTGLATYQTSIPGSHNFTFSFNVNGSLVTKRVCINATAGISVIDPIAFTALVNQPLSTLLKSEVVLITGNTVLVPVSIINGEYSFDGLIWSSQSGFVPQNSSIQVRQTSANTQNTKTTATLTVGNQNANFDVTTMVQTAKITINLTEQGNSNSPTPPYADVNAFAKDNGVQVSTRVVTTGVDVSYVVAGHEALIMAFVERDTNGSNATITVNMHKNGQQLTGWPQTVASVPGNSITFKEICAANDDYVADISSHADPATSPQP